MQPPGNCETTSRVEVFRRPARLDLERVVEFDEIVTCLPIVQEVLQGFADERAFQIAQEAMHALPIVESPPGRSVFDEAVALFRTARRAGLTVRSGVDCLIAACAIRHGLTVLHANRDFDQLARIAPLDAKRASTSGRSQPRQGTN